MEKRTHAAAKSLPPALLEFATERYGSHDSSHDLEHGLRVYCNAKWIVEQLGYQMTLVIIYAAVLHDILDSKYVPKDKYEAAKESLLTFLGCHLPESECDDVIWIIENISWSKRKQSQSMQRDDWRRLVVQDADWLEAIHQVGLERCIEYTTTRNPNASRAKVRELVCEHINTKLVHIPAALNTAPGKRLAEGGLEPLVEYLSAGY